EGHRYIVALRLGSGVSVDPTFAAYRDGTAINDSNPAQAKFDEQRRAHFENLFTALHDKAGIDPSTLTQAWDFTVATGDNLAGRMLAIRNDAFRQLGDRDLSDLSLKGTRAPTFTLTRVIDETCGARKSAAGAVGQSDPTNQDAFVTDFH